MSKNNPTHKIPIQKALFQIFLIICRIIFSDGESLFSFSIISVLLLITSFMDFLDYKILGIVGPLEAYSVSLILQELVSYVSIIEQ